MLFWQHALRLVIRALSCALTGKVLETFVSTDQKIDPAPMCFACGVDNPIGLKIKYVLENDRVTAHFTPNEQHVGYQDTVHGGIIYAALDDVMANCLYLQNIKAYTARCEIRYRQALKVGQAVDLVGWIEQRKRRLVILKGEARLANSDMLVAECDASFMLV